MKKKFCLLYGEVAEAYDAVKMKRDNIAEEFADIAIYLMGSAEILLLYERVNINCAGVNSTA